MKLGRLRNALSILLIAGMLSHPILGTESVQNNEVTSSVDTEMQATVARVGIGEYLDGKEKEIQFIRQYGDAVNISVVKDNIKLTVEYMLADAYTTNLLISVEKIDGLPFKASERLRIKGVDLKSKEEIEKQAKFEAIPEDAPFVVGLKVMAEYNEDLKAFIKEDDTVDTEGLMAYFGEAEGMGIGTSGASYGMCPTEENTDSKVYFTYKGSYNEPILKEMVLCIDSIMGEKEKSEDIATDLVSYLKAHEGEAVRTKPNTIEEEEKAYLEELKQTNAERYLIEKEELENQPHTLLTESGLGIRLKKEENSLVMDNIGFIDGKLHLLMIGEGTNRCHLELYDEKGEQVSASYNTGSSSKLEDGSRKTEDYYIYDIDSIEALSQYHFKIRGSEVVEEWQGPWEINLDRSNATQSQVIKVDEMVPYRTDKHAHLSELHIGKGSIVLVLDQMESKHSNETISMKIKLKDGTERELDYSSAFNQNADQLTLVYSLNYIVGEDIERVAIDDKIIYQRK